MKNAEDILEKAKKWNQRKRQLLRDAANWFHGKEGELIPRKNAMEQLASHLDVEKVLAAHLIAALVEDKVDPVVQVIKEDTKKVGIIEYREGDSWYGYIHEDDVEGEKKRVVCAKCVEEMEKDSEIAYAEPGIGSAPEDADWEELISLVEEHYEDSHEKDLAGVKTGATLKVDTTIGSNTVWHLANDGPGTGLHADKVDNEENTFWGKIGEEYIIETGELGPVASSFSAPGPSAWGVGVDSSGCIWHVDESTSTYKLTQDGSVVSQYGSPSDADNWRGLGVDSDDCIWVATYGGAGGLLGNTAMLKMDQSWNLMTAVSISPGANTNNDPRGLGVDHSTGCIWYGVGADSAIYKLDRSGNAVTSFSSPAGGLASMGDVGVDPEGCIWHGDIGTGSLYKLDQSGTVESQLSSPGSAATGIGYETGSLWHADDSTDEIYRVVKPRRLYRT